MAAPRGTGDRERLRPTLLAVLGAGAGERFRGHGHKLDARLGGATIIERSTRAALAADCGPVIVVLGAGDHDVPAGATVVGNERWQEGLATSLQVAVRHAAAIDADAVVIGLADQPFIEPTAWRRVAEATAPLAIAGFDGRRSPPVRLHHSIWHLLPTRGDLGARHLIARRPDLIEEVPCHGSPADIDTVEDLAAWQNRLSTPSP